MFFTIKQMHPNSMEICKNCKTYGKIEYGIVVLPCTNCATENNWTWNGKKCYGSQGDGELNEIDLINIVYNIFYISRFYKILDKIEKSNNSDYSSMNDNEKVINYICDNLIPKECIDSFCDLVNN